MKRQENMIDQNSIMAQALTTGLCLITLITLANIASIATIISAAFTCYLAWVKIKKEKK